jgi:hypothetical protein
MIARYGIRTEDQQNYKRDHRALVVSVLLSGALVGLVVAALLTLTLSTGFPLIWPEDLLFALLICSLPLAAGSHILLARVRRDRS